jgi:hypothetical protein
MKLVLNYRLFSIKIAYNHVSIIDLILINIVKYMIIYRDMITNFVNF